MADSVTTDQRSLWAQLRELRQHAVDEGMYDAADWIKDRWNERVAPDSTVRL